VAANNVTIWTKRNRTAQKKTEEKTRGGEKGGGERNVPAGGAEIAEVLANHMTMGWRLTVGERRNGKDLRVPDRGGNLGRDNHKGQIKNTPAN